jgi:uncharacterized membrane protein
MTPDPLTTGLPRRVAAPLAYAGWWVTGVLFWLLERRDRYVRFHAAQACVAFGAIAGVVATLSAIAATSLMFMPNAFGFWVWTAGLIWVAGLILWVIAIWNAATGRAWRIPIAADIADRMCSGMASHDQRSRLRAR